MIYHLLTKHYGSIVEKKLSNWLDENTSKARGQAYFKSKYSTIDHIFTFLNYFENYRNDKEDIFAYFINFRKTLILFLRVKF